MDIKELESKFKDLSGQIDTMKKDFELKLQSAEKNSEEYKTLAFQREEELRKVKEAQAKKDFEQKQQAETTKKEETKKFVESMVKEGKISPAQSELVTTLMGSMTTDGEVAKFTEADGSIKSHSQVSLFKAFLSTLKKSVPLGTEFTPAGKGMKASVPDGEEQIQTFMKVRSEGSVQELAVDDADIAQKAFQYIEEQGKLGRKIDYYEALIELTPKKVSA